MVPQKPLSFRNQVAVSQTRPWQEPVSDELIFQNTKVLQIFAFSLIGVPDLTGMTPRFTKLVVHHFLKMAAFLVE